jgi:elongation factor P
MILAASKLRKGMIILYENTPHQVVNFSHVVTGRGGANIQSKLRNLESGKNVEYRWSSDEKFEEIELEQVLMEFLYQDGEQYCFMNNQTYEQILLGKDILGDDTQFLVENLQVNILFHNGHPLSVALPKSVVLTITETAPAMKGGTVPVATKPATCNTGLVVQVPLFIESGEKIIVITETGAYESRAKG